MAQDSSTARPPSPPHSPGGQYTQGDHDQMSAPSHHKLEPYTPPMPANSFMSELALHQAYDPYGDPSLYHTAPQPVFYAPQHTMNTSAPSHTPPQNIGVLTRSGRAIGTPSSQADTASSRASPSPKARRTTRKKATAKKGGPAIDQPLSLLTKDYKTPVRDMALWVNRPVEDRLAEVEKKKGYVSRPMNSFMLYRSAYAERVKQFCKENNHQVVSQVTGASWPLEPKEVREMYERFAIVERDNHAAAHPTYKFAPNKAKRARNDDDSDSDGEWEGSIKGSKRSRSARRFDSRSASSTPFEERPIMYQRMMPAQHHLAAYEMGNPYGHPQMMVSNGMEYYQPAHGLGVYEQYSDIPQRRYQEPYQQYHPSLGMENPQQDNDPYGLLASYDAPQPMAVSVQSNMLDPRLGHGSSNHVFYDDDKILQENPRTIDYGSGPQLDDLVYGSEAYHPGLTTLAGENDEWADRANAGSDFEAEFSRLS